MKTKILVYVAGGVVSRILSDDLKLDIAVVDMDAVECGDQEVPASLKGLIRHAETGLDLRTWKEYVL